MRFRQGVAILSGALLLTPAVLVGATRECPVGQPTSRSYTWNFRSEADNIFNRMQGEATAVRNATNGLQQDAYETDLTWQVHAQKLNRVRRDVNSMGEDLCRLQTIRRELSPAQKKMLDRVAPRVRSLAANTEAAIKTLNKNHDTLYAANYPQRVGQIYQEATSLSKSVNNFLVLAKLRHEGQGLSHPAEAAS